MSAREMFEELGYEYSYLPRSHKIDCFLDNDKEHHMTQHRAIFFKRKKLVELNGVFNEKELKAIYKQIEELGW